MDIELVKGDDIKRACWQWACLAGKVPEKVLEDQGSYTGVLIVNSPTVNGNSNGTLDDVRFVIRKKDV